LCWYQHTRARAHTHIKRCNINLHGYFNPIMFHVPDHYTMFVFVRRYLAGRGLAANNILAFHSSAKFIGGFNAFCLPLISCLPFKHIVFWWIIQAPRLYSHFPLIYRLLLLLPIALSNFYSFSKPVPLTAAWISDCFEYIGFSSESG